MDSTKVMKNKFPFIFICLALLVAGCSAAPGIRVKPIPSVPMKSPSPSIAFTPTTIPSATPTLKPTQTLTPTPIPMPTERIGIDNLNRLVKFYEWGTGFALDLQWAADGSSFAVLSATHLTVYDAKSYQETLEIAITDPYYTKFTFSPDAKLLAYVGFDGKVIVYNLVDLNSLRDFAVLSGRMCGLSFNTDLDKLAILYCKKGFSILDLKTGESINYYNPLDQKEKTNWSSDIRFSDDSNQVHLLQYLSGIWKVTIWDINQGSRDVEENDIQINMYADPGFQFLQDSRYILGRVDGGNIIVFDRSEKKIVYRVTVPNNGAYLASVSNDLTTLVYATNNDGGSVVLYDLSNDRKIGTIVKGIGGNVGKLIFSPDHRYLFFSTLSGELKLISISDGKNVGVFDASTGILRSVAMSPDGDQVSAVSYEKGEVTLLSVPSMQVIQTHAIYGGKMNGVYQGVYSPDGKYWAGPSENDAPVISIVDRTTGVSYQELKLSGSPGEFRFTPGGQLFTWIVRTSIGNNIGVLDLRSGEIEMLSAEGKPQSNPDTVDVSPDGKIMAYIQTNNNYTNSNPVSELVFWDLQEEKLIQKERLPHWLYSVKLVYSNDGKWLAFYDNENGKVSVYNAVSRQLSREIATQSDFISGIAFSPDGSILAIGLDFHITKLFDVTTGKELLELNGGGEFSFSEDGRLLMMSNLLQIQIYGIKPVD